MGGSKSTNVTKSFFKSEEVEQLRAVFLKLDSPVFGHSSFPDLDQQIKSYISNHMKGPKDFAGFVGVLEYIIFGKSMQIDVFNSTSLMILLEIIPDKSCITDYLISMSNAIEDLKLYIALPSSDPKRISDYYDHYFPLLGTSFARFIKNKLFNSLISAPPIVNLENRSISKVIDLLYFSTFNLQNSAAELHPLFLSDNDGFSFTKLVQAISGYFGTMILVLKLDEDKIIGAHIGEGLKDNASVSGSMDTFLFSLVGGFKTFKPEYGNMQGKYLYLNSKINKSNKFPKGLGFGGSKDEARLWLDYDLDSGSYVSDSCGTFENGKLVETPGHEVHITIVTIEIWGCGGDRALQTQQKIKKSDDIRVTNARKIDKTELAGNQFNREHLLGGTFKNSQYKND